MLRGDKVTFTGNRLHFRDAVFAHERVVAFQIKSLPVVTRMLHLIQSKRENNRIKNL